MVKIQTHTRKVILMQENLNLYYVFFTVAKNLNITTAAKELYISQPAVSKSISKLEDNLGIQLFTRSSKGVSLTYEGELLYQKLSTAFYSIEQGEMQLKKITKYSVGHISIGVSTTLCKYVLLPYLTKFKKAYPHISISISCQSSVETLQAISKEQLDIGLIGQPKENPQFCFHSIREIRDLFVTTPEYLSSLRDLHGDNPDYTKNATFLLLNKANLTRQHIDHYLEANDIVFENIMEVSSMDLLIEFAKTGLGIAAVIESFVQDDIDTGILVPFSFDADFPSRNIGFVYAKDMPHTKAMESFLSFLSQEGVS